MDYLDNGQSGALSSVRCWHLPPIDGSPGQVSVSVSDFFLDKIRPANSTCSADLGCVKKISVL